MLHIARWRVTILDLKILLNAQVSLSLSCWPAHDRARRCDMARQMVILQDACPWPPIHADTRSPSVLASPGPAIEFAVLPCALCRTGNRCRTPGGA